MSVDTVRENLTERVETFTHRGRPWLLRLNKGRFSAYGFEPGSGSYITPLDRIDDPRWPSYLMQCFRGHLDRGEAIGIIEAAYAKS